MTGFGMHSEPAAQPAAVPTGPTKHAVPTDATDPDATTRGLRDFADEASRMRWQLAIEAAGVGTFEWHFETDELIWDDALMEMFGYDRTSFTDHISAFTQRLHPEDVNLVQQAVRTSIEDVGVYAAEYRIVLPNGSTRWVHARGRTLADLSGKGAQMVGAVIDTTATHAGEARLAEVMAAMPAALVTLDRQWCITFINAEAEQLLAMTHDQLIGQALWDLFPGAVGTEFDLTCRAAMASGQTKTLEAFYPAPLNAWLDLRVAPGLEGASLYFVDVSDRRAAQELVQLATTVGEQLLSWLDVDRAVRELAQMVVPRLADWSIVSTLDSEGVLRDVAGWHADATLRPVVQEFQAHRFDGRIGVGPIIEAMRAGEPTVTTSNVTAQALKVLVAPEAVEAMQILDPQSTISLPLRANDRVSGVLSLFRGRDRSSLSAEEISVAVSIADRAGLALDNARLYDEQRASAARLSEANDRLERVAEHDRTVARALQDALLTELPQPDHLLLAGRYLTAAGDTQVGGDWYDAVVLSTGTTTLSIGDVVGHDIVAAASMGQLRNLLRGFSWDHGADPPSAILTRLDTAIRELKLTTMATCALVQIEQSAVDRQQGNRRIRWSSAGHLPPVLLHADGTAEILHAGTDLMLGVDPTARRRDHVEVMPPDSTLVLFTDGLVESRTQDFTDGIERLRRSLAAHAGLSLEPLLDTVVAELVGDHPEDDVAVLGVRFDRQH